MYSLPAHNSSCSSQEQQQQQQQQKQILPQLPYNLRPQPLGLASSSNECVSAAVVAPAVVLAGHSMGGVVARAAASAAWEDPELGGKRLYMFDLVVCAACLLPGLLLVRVTQLSTSPM
jgi:hypothetical protein